LVFITETEIIVFHVDAGYNLLSILKFSYLNFLIPIYCFRTRTY